MVASCAFWRSYGRWAGVLMSFALSGCRCVHRGRGEDADGRVERLVGQPVGHQVGVHCDSRYEWLIACL